MVIQYGVDEPARRGRDIEAMERFPTKQIRQAIFPERIAPTLVGFDHAVAEAKQPVTWFEHVLDHVDRRSP